MTRSSSGRYDPVDLLITFGSADKEQHLEALTSLGGAFGVSAAAVSPGQGT